jgi:transcriptional regulator with XRE-family HTH domain
MAKIKYNRLKTVITESEVTSSYIAKEQDKTESTVSRWCTNDVQPPVEELYRIAKYLDVDIRELLVSTKG